MPGSLTCKFETCDREVYVEKWQLCSAHYNQQCRGRELRPLRGTTEWRSISVVDERKVCTRCGYDLPLGDFYAKGECNGIRAHCRRCNILRRMGMTARDFDERLAQQGGGCAICGATESLNRKTLAVDHDHRCCGPGKACGKCVRGILCDNCNHAIGLLRDDAGLARMAALYLDGAVC